MEFTIKPAKKKKRGKGAQVVQTICDLTHCPRVADCCTQWECEQKMNDTIQSLENEKLALSISADGRHEETKRLVTEIEKECDMASFSNVQMSSSYATFKAGVEARPPICKCECPECRQKLGYSEVALMARRLAVTQDWLAALREYRSKYDLELLQRQSGLDTHYFTSGKYFQQNGSYRGHGAATIKPRLQMQNSYNVAALTTNDVVNRPLKKAWSKRTAAMPEGPVIPGLQGNCARLADGRVLVHDGSYTTNNGRTIELSETTVISTPDPKLRNRTLKLTLD